MAPLLGVKVLDFSTLLPGPFATLLLAEAGAEVIKVERPGGGDEMRNREPRLGSDSTTFALLNRGKRSIAVDLKDTSALARLTPLIETADVLLEQFRPGVMERLGLGYDAVRALNSRLIYCSLSGYGQSGSRAKLAGHDINYLAESGLLSLVSGRDGTPALPAVPIADLAGGSYPLVINILLALLQVARTGEGCHLDIAMADNVMCLGYWALARGLRTGEWPQPDGDTITGARARYRNYRCRDGRFIAVGALEEKFWQTFCDIIDLPDDLRDDRRAPEQSFRGVAERLAMQDSSYWERTFAGRDICCTIVKTMEEAVRSPAATERGLWGRTTIAGGDSMPALPVPLVDALRSDARSRAAPQLGEGNGTLIAEP